MSAILQFDRTLIPDLSAALGNEWLETNGLGGYASSSLIGANTRRYHGLLVAATKPPVGRIVMLSKLEETLVVNDSRFQLATNQYPGSVHPDGFQFFRNFRLDPYPIVTFEAGGLQIEKSVFMVNGENTTVVRYQVMDWRKAEGGAKVCKLELRPLIAFRDFHGLTHANSALDPTVELQDGMASVQPYGDLPLLYFGHNAKTVETQGCWYNKFEYAREQDRGLDFQEDLFNPLTLTVELSPKSPETWVVASLQPRSASDAPALRTADLAYRKKIAEIGIKPSAPKAQSDIRRLLNTAADQFIVARGSNKTVIAGYHWFSDWGRDTMISLPGLTLCTGRFDAAKDILQTFAGSVSQGMLPNRFSDYGEEPEYNTVDATLWFFHAVHEYSRYSGDTEFVLKLYPVLREIVDFHVRGTRHGIHMDSDGLLAAGAPGVQLTWMDAKVGDWVVTPRCGKPVEIQALWYNALRVMEGFARQAKDKDSVTRYAQMAENAKQSFNREFWIEGTGYLYDVVTDSGKDASLRPNQIFTVSLPHSMLEPKHAAAVVAIVDKELRTPYGLRTLARSHHDYRGRFHGNPMERDSAYHQGTVWPWLIGPFVTAYMKTNGRNRQSREQAASFLAPLLGQFGHAGIGQISEVFDGDELHHPGACIAQAWSVAEVLRCLVEDIQGVTPESLRKKA